MIKDKYDIIILGGGPAGLGAMMNALEAGISDVLLIEKERTVGGLLMQCIHRGFGSEDLEMTGPEYREALVNKLKDRIKKISSNAYRNIKPGILTDCAVIKIEDDHVTVSGQMTGIRNIGYKALIYAAGCRENNAGAIGIAGSRPSGVFTAGQAQYMLNVKGYDIGDNIVILGSGDVGMIVARQLVINGKTVKAVIEKEDHCGGLQKNREECLEKYGIPIIFSANVKEIRGMPRIEGVTFEDMSGAEHYMTCDTLILSTGLVPERQLIWNRIPENVILCGNAEKIYVNVMQIEKSAKEAAEKAVRICNGFF